MQTRVASLPHGTKPFVLEVDQEAMLGSMLLAALKLNHKKGVKNPHAMRCSDCECDCVVTVTQMKAMASASLGRVLSQCPPFD